MMIINEIAVKEGRFSKLDFLILDCLWLAVSTSHVPHWTAWRGATKRRTVAVMNAASFSANTTSTLSSSAPKRRKTL